MEVSGSVGLSCRVSSGSGFRVLGFGSRILGFSAEVYCKVGSWPG